MPSNIRENQYRITRADMSINSFIKKGENYHVLDANTAHLRIEHMMVCSTKLVTFRLDKRSPLLNGQFVVITLRAMGPKASMLIEEIMDFMPLPFPWHHKLVLVQLSSMPHIGSCPQAACTPRH
jgi:hypothetical protein